MSRRPDVAVITAPLLGADWYRAEVAERHGLLPVEAVQANMTQAQRLRALAGLAASAGRVLSASVFVDSGRRAQLGRGWTFDGIAFHARPGLSGTTVDVVEAGRVAALIPDVLDLEPLDAPDRAPRYMARTLRCPGLIARSPMPTHLVDSLDSTCNLR